VPLCSGHRHHFDYIWSGGDLDLSTHDLKRKQLVAQLWELFSQGLVKIPSLVHELPRSKDSFRYHWTTLTFEPMTFSVPSLSSVLAIMINWDRFRQNISSHSRDPNVNRWTDAQTHRQTHTRRTPYVAWRGYLRPLAWGKVSTSPVCKIFCSE